MSWNDSTNQTPVFFEDRPDYQRGFSLWQKWVTDVATAFSGAEQRARRRSRPTYELMMFRTEQLSTFAVRRARMLQEVGRPIVVPIWTHPEDISVNTGGGNTITLGVTTLAKSAFREGSYVYFVESGKTSTFRQISAVGTTTITCVAGNCAFPDIPMPSYTTAGVAYPCILGMRQENVAEFNPMRPEATNLPLHVLEL